MNIYVKCKKNSNSGLLVGHSENFTKAIYGFSELGAKIIPYQSLDDIYDIVTKEDIVIDYIQQCDAIFAKFGYHNVHVDDYPECLKKYLGRNICYDTINSISSKKEKWSAGWFVKPVKTKVFTGKVIQSIHDLIGCGHCQEDYEVICSDALDIKREWRCFIYYDEIIDIRPYKGDYHYTYDSSVIDHIMDDFKKWDKRPMACSIDIGVTSDNKTILIECNDAYALGSYGLVDFRYAKFISARWAQIMEREDEFDFRKYGSDKC
ncbi:ATP-grasp domain-containing protein [Erysipelatoclostridium sp. AM42-17]|uniref:ATP-grasp domain-containing protein n=1 Tax=Erysipelatoclostridium sp. AM42-17 TaxID=2293102 RepID=UPI0018F52EF3|nr:ATP-grasp domain-containing protein [Erysipelatoclostridium sp. AM42-17]